MNFNHKSVLLKESVNSLNIKPDGIYVDGTAGGGGHSAEILKRLGEKGKLIAVDQDPDALKILEERFGSDKRVKIVNSNFSALGNILDTAGVSKIDGLLLDIGVSSYQLDTAERGFSYHFNAPLDMRMSKTGISAYDVINNYNKEQLEKVIFSYGEEKFARSIAGNIVKYREEKHIETTDELVEIIKASMPESAKRGSHPARKTFQAIRIEVNGELDALKQVLEQALAVLSEGGVISVITFHSLEDRIVKNEFRSWAQGCTCPKDFPVCVCGKKPKVKLLKPVTPSDEELNSNKRSRSAKLRTAIKL